MQGFNVCGYEVRVFGATVTQCFEAMDGFKPLVAELKPLERPSLPKMESVLECYSGDGFEWAWHILQNWA